MEDYNKSIDIRQIFKCIPNEVVEEEILVSIVVPIYNQEKYLSKCLDSLLYQTYKNIEIICVNDGSVDGSKAIIEDYKNRDTRIVLIDKSNEGLSMARKDGIAISNGCFITIVDSDDWLDKMLYYTP